MATTDPDRRVLVAADLDIDPRRDNASLYRAQLGFREVLETACRRLGLDRADWLVQRAGDGELAILPPGTDPRDIVARLPPTVDRLVRDRNRHLPPDERLRLRIVIHEGPVHLDGAPGFPGEAVITVCGLLASPGIAEALRRRPTAGVALVVSDRVHRNAVVPHGDPPPARFTPLNAAWIHVPGEE